MMARGVIGDSAATMPSPIASAETARTGRARDSETLSLRERPGNRSHRNHDDGCSAGHQKRLVAAERPACSRRDDAMHANTGHDQAEIERKVRIAPDVKPECVTMTADEPFRCRGGDIEVPPPHEEQERHSRERRRRRNNRPVLLALHAVHDGDDRLRQARST